MAQSQCICESSESQHVFVSHLSLFQLGSLQWFIISKLLSLRSSSYSNPSLLLLCRLPLLLLLRLALHHSKAPPNAVVKVLLDPARVEPSSLHELHHLGRVLHVDGPVFEQPVVVVVDLVQQGLPKRWSQVSCYITHLESTRKRLTSSSSCLMCGGKVDFRPPFFLLLEQTWAAGICFLWLCLGPFFNGSHFL